MAGKIPSRHAPGKQVLTGVCTFQIMCGYDLYDPNPEERSVQPSLNACILACNSAYPGACPGVTWVESGQDQQWCYYKPASATFLDVDVPAIQSARRICFPTTPTCPSGNQTLYQSKLMPKMDLVLRGPLLTNNVPGTDGSVFRLDCNIDYPANDMGMMQANSIQTCMDTCDQRGDTCAGSVFVPSWAANPNTNPYSCFLKIIVASEDATQQVYESNTVVRLSTGSILATGTEVSCTVDNNLVYQTADGSQFQIVCSTDVSPRHQADTWPSIGRC